MASRVIVSRIRFLARVLLLVVVPLAVAIAVLGWYARGGRHVQTENAYVKADVIAISADVSGRVASVAVRDNQPVQKGALLFEIDSAPFAFEVARAEALMASVRTDLVGLRADYSVALAEAKEAEARIPFLMRQVERQSQLKARGMSREDRYDELRNDLEAAHRRLDSIRERGRRVLASLGGDLRRPLEQHPRYLQARAARDTAQLDLARTRIVAPASGVISNMRLQAGEHIARGVPVFSLVEDSAPWIEANYKETQLTHMRVGQAASVVADAFPDHAWRARVRTIAPATGSEFAVLPPQNATGNWVKVVQRVPVHLSIEAAPGDPPLRAGMTVTVEVDTGRERGLPNLLRPLVEHSPAFVRHWLVPAHASSG